MPGLSLSRAALLGVLVVVPLRVAGEPALGVWLTQPDRKGGVAHVQAARCGAALCGTVLRAFDREGRAITTPNVGKLVFWNMKPSGNGVYHGRAWVPAHNREYDGVMQVRGNRMKVSGCLGPVCQAQVWTRVK